MRKPVQTPWLQPIQLLQFCTILWLVAAQLIACYVQHIDDFTRISIAISCASSIFISMILFLFLELKNWQAFLLLILEIGLVTISSTTCIVAGFQLLFLITALKSGIVVGRFSFAAICTMAVLCFTIFSQTNSNLVIQSNGSSNDIVSLLFGREFVGFAIGLILIAVLVSAMRREQQNRKEAERLSEKLVALATELERNRISREINEKVDGLLEQVVGEVEHTGELLTGDSTQPLTALKRARELASSALTEVRRSLALLRDFESLKILLLLLFFSLSLSSCQNTSRVGITSANSNASRTATTGSEDNLDANSKAALELFKTGLKYQQSGRVELSRKALDDAIELDPTGKVGNSARVVLRTKLPRYPVSADAEQRNVIGFNQMNHGDISAAQKTFLALIEEFPQFEYPYGNLVYLYIQERKLNEAKALLKRVLQINPNYLNGWKYLAEVQRIERDTAGYKQSSERISALRLGREVGSDDSSVTVD